MYTLIMHTAALCDIVEVSDCVESYCCVVVNVAHCCCKRFWLQLQQNVSCFLFIFGVFLVILRHIVIKHCHLILSTLLSILHSMVTMCGVRQCLTLDIFCKRVMFSVTRLSFVLSGQITNPQEQEFMVHYQILLWQFMTAFQLINVFYTVSQKIIPPLTCYSLHIHYPITIIFGKRLAWGMSPKYFVLSGM